jgi:hypothetical protein
MPETNDPRNNLDQELHARQGEAVKDMNDLIDQRMTWSIQRLGDEATIATGNLKESYLKKAAELSQESGRLEGQIDNQEVLKMQETILQGLSQRLSLVLDIAGGTGVEDSVATSQQLQQLGTMGTTIIGNTDIPGLIHKHLLNLERTKPLKYPGIAARYEQSIGRSIAPDTYELLKKTVKPNEELTEEDWKTLVYYLKQLGDKNLRFPDKSVAIALMASLRPEQRAQLVEHLPQDAAFPPLCADLVSSSYLTADHVEAFVLPKIEALTAELKKDPGNKVTADQLKLYTDTLTGIHSPKVQAFQQTVEQARLQAPARMARGVTYGQRNTARELLTFKGIGSTLLAVNGAMTIGANLLMDITDPASIPGNTALWLGVAQLGVGMEGSRGIAGLVPQPSKGLAHLLTDKDKAEDDQKKQATEAFSRSFGNHSLEARFYYTFTDKIMKAYTEQKKIQDTGRPLLKIEDLGLKWEDMPEVYRTESKEFFMKQISEWAATYAITYQILTPGGDEGKDGQRWHMNELRKRLRGFQTNYEIDPELAKLTKPAK